MALLCVRVFPAFTSRHNCVREMSTNNRNGKHVFKRQQKTNSKNKNKVINQSFKALNTINLSVYNIVQGLSSRVEVIFGRVKVSVKPMIVTLAKTLFKFVIMNNTMTYQSLKSLSLELGLKDANKVNILNAFSKRYVEKSLLLAIYYVKYINTRISSAEYRHMETTTFGVRKYPLLMLKFISLIGFNKRVQRFGENSSFLEIDRETFTFPSTKISKGEIIDFEEIKDDMGFIVDLENLVNASELVDANLLQSIDLCTDFPVYDNLISCIPCEINGVRGVKHSTSVPTEIELCESILFGINYKITDVPEHLIGSIFYQVPEVYDQLLGIRYWENILGKTIPTESKLVSSAPDFDSGTYKEIANRPSSISTITQGEVKESVLDQDLLRLKKEPVQTSSTEKPDLPRGGGNSVG